MQKVATFDNEFTDYPVSVERNSGGLFRIIYGQQVGRWMKEHEAAAELGHCLFHSMQCAGALDKRR